MYVGGACHISLIVDQFRVCAGRCSSPFVRARLRRSRRSQIAPTARTTSHGPPSDTRPPPMPGVMPGVVCTPRPMPVESATAERARTPGSSCACVHQCQHSSAREYSRRTSTRRLAGAACRLTALETRLAPPPAAPGRHPRSTSNAGGEGRRRWDRLRMARAAAGLGLLVPDNRMKKKDG